MLWCEKTISIKLDIIICIINFILINVFESIKKKKNDKNPLNYAIPVILQRLETRFFTTRRWQRVRYKTELIPAERPQWKRDTSDAKWLRRAARHQRRGKRRRRRRRRWRCKRKRGEKREKRREEKKGGERKKGRKRSKRPNMNEGNGRARRQEIGEARNN